MRFFRHFPILIAALLLVQPGFGQSRSDTGAPRTAEPGKEPGKGESGKEGEKKRADLPPPIAFFVAKGEPDACGPGCSEWIAADGLFDTGAAERFGAFIKRFGKRMPPVYFHSPGGSVRDAAEIGRLMRDRGMRAGVGRTIPRGCDPKQEREATCDSLKRAGRELLADLRTIHTLCNSACVYALIGAAEREVAPGARLGVHTIAVARRNAEGILTSREGPLSPLEEKQIKIGNDRLRNYIREMGIDLGLFQAANEIAHDRVRYISRDEIARFGIDARAFQESRWTPDEGRTFAVYKFITDARGEPKAYRTTRIRLTCTRSREIRVDFSRELATAEGARDPIAMTTASGDIVLPPGRGKPAVGYNDILMEDRSAVVAPSFFEEAAKGDSIALLAASRSSAAGAPPSIKLSTVGLSSAVKALMQSCR